MTSPGSREAVDLSTEVLRTARLDLLPLSLPFCEAILAGDRAAASRILGFEVGAWPEGGELEFAFPAYARNLARDPSLAAWQGRAIVVRDAGVVAGSVNLKGPPRNGRVEVGYGLVETHRGRGYAREAAAAVVARAFRDPATREVTAVIDPENAPSIRIAESLGMRRTGELSSEHAGAYVWVISRDAWEAREGLSAAP